MQALCAQFDALEVELIELNVRRDNPTALLFWEAQGFRIALYHLRQYRDPKTGTAFIGGYLLNLSAILKLEMFEPIELSAGVFFLVLLLLIRVFGDG